MSVTPLASITTSRTGVSRLFYRGHEFARIERRIGEVQRGRRGRTRGHQARAPRLRPAAATRPSAGRAANLRAERTRQRRKLCSSDRTMLASIPVSIGSPTTSRVLAATSQIPSSRRGGRCRRFRSAGKCAARPRSRYLPEQRAARTRSARRRRTTTLRPVPPQPMTPPGEPPPAETTTAVRGGLALTAKPPISPARTQPAPMPPKSRAT